MICPQCHTPNREGDRFCEQCGAPLDTSMEQPFGAQLDVAATLMATSPAASVLVRLGGDDEQEKYPLGTRVVIGRLDSCDIPIHDKSVSREHARLSRLRDGYVIEDLGSTNGTLVNGQRIEEATLLYPGDGVTIGAIDFRFELEDMPAASHEPAPFSSPWENMQGEAQGTEFPFAPQSGQPLESPTLRDLPFISPAFPDLEQPPSIASQQSAEAAGPDVAGTPERSEQLDAMKAALGFTSDSPPPPAQIDEPPQATPFVEHEFPTPAPFQSGALEEAPVEQAPPIQPVPSFELSPEAPSSFPQAPAAETTGSDDDLVNEAQTVAYRLTELISDLAGHLQDSRVKHTEAKQQLQSLQEIDRTHQTVKKIVQGIPGRALSSEQLGSLREMTDALAANPRDVEVLMRVAQHSANLATVVDA